MPRSKKKKPGNGRTKQFETIFCIAELGIFLLLWILKVFFQVDAGQLIAVYFISNIVLIVVLRAFDRKAAEHALDILSRPV